MIRRLSFLILSLFLLQGCGSGGGRGGALRIGIDPAWYPIDFGLQASYVNGFTEELLLEISRSTGIEFERITANWDSLYDGLKKRQFDAVLTSMPRYDFNVAEYDMSSNFLDLGPVLILPASAAKVDLNKMVGMHVGAITGDPSALALQKYPQIMVRATYASIPELLDAVLTGEIEGAILEWIPAVNFLADLYAGKLKIATSPLNDMGLHLVVMKGQHARVLAQFNKNIDLFQKKKKMQKLLAKWQLGV